MALGAGARVGIIGESGSGKSVTAMSILRLNDERQMAYGRTSRVDFEGKNILTASAAELTEIRGKRIAMIFQDPMSTLNPLIRVGRQILDVLLTHKPLPRGEAKDKVMSSLDAVGIRTSERVFSSYPHQLSGGMRQRVMIAMAIASEPQLLIADEATSALDVTVQDAVLDTIEQLAEERGMSVLMITHDMGVAARFCDDVYVMNRGEVVESGRMADVIIAPEHSYTKKLLASVPRVYPLDRVTNQPRA
nr:ABC transporter ATP-binding protein [Garicola koreensis]